MLKYDDISIGDLRILEYSRMWDVEYEPPLRVTVTVVDKSPSLASFYGVIEERPDAPAFGTYDHEICWEKEGIDEYFSSRGQELREKQDGYNVIVKEEWMLITGAQYELTPSLSWKKK